MGRSTPLKGIEEYLDEFKSHRFVWPPSTAAAVVDVKGYFDREAVSADAASTEVIIK